MIFDIYGNYKQNNFFWFRILPKVGEAVGLVLGDFVGKAVGVLVGFRVGLADGSTVGGGGGGAC